MSPAVVVDAGFFVSLFEPARTIERGKGRAMVVFRLLLHRPWQMGLSEKELSGDESVLELKALLPPSLVARILGLASSNS